MIDKSLLHVMEMKNLVREGILDPPGKRGPLEIQEVLAPLVPKEMLQMSQLLK